MPNSSDSTELRVFIAGGKTPLAENLTRFIRLAAEDVQATVVVRAPSPRNVDPRDPYQLFEAIADLRPHVMFNAYGFDSMEYCEEHPEETRVGNAEVPAYMAMAAKAYGSWLVQFSTCYVFKGNAGPYAVEDEPFPVQWYGTSKLLGETVIRQIAPEMSTILRLGWLYGREYSSPATPIIQGLQSGAPDDVKGSLCYLPHVSFRVVDNLFRGRLIGTPGVFHIAPAEGNMVSWYEALSRRFKDVKPGESIRKRKLSYPRQIGLRPSFYWHIPDPHEALLDYRIDVFEPDEVNDWMTWYQSWSGTP